ncbi:MAG: hypothetical protein HQL84_16545, partial [Magnetococcales bacterium]|nr:hypothetical protein [Magnetococcales bacterium]
MEHPGIQEVRERLITAAQTADPSLLAKMLAGQFIPAMGGNRHPADIMIQALSGAPPEIPGQLAELMARLCHQKADELEQTLSLSLSMVGDNAPCSPETGGFVADQLPDETFLFNLFLLASFLPRTKSLFDALARFHGEEPRLNLFASGMGRSPRQFNEALVRQQTDDRFAQRWLNQLKIPYEKDQPLSDDQLNALLEAWRALLWIPPAEAQCKKGETIDFDRVERGLLCIADTMQGRPEEQEVLDLVLGRLDRTYGRSAEFWQTRLAPLMTHCPDHLKQAIHAYWPTPLTEAAPPLRFPDEQTQAVWTHLGDAQQNNILGEAKNNQWNTLDRLVFSLSPSDRRHIPAIKSHLRQFLGLPHPSDAHKIKQQGIVEADQTPSGNKRNAPPPKKRPSKHDAFTNVKNIMETIETRLKGKDLYHAKEFLADLLIWQKANGTSDDLIAKTLSNVATMALRHSHPQWAEELNKLAQEHAPTDVVAKTGLAETLRAQNKFSDAETLYRQTVAQFPDNVVAKTGLAETLRAQNKFS